MLTEQSPPPTGTLAASWQTLADALHVLRVHLALDQWKSCADSDDATACMLPPGMSPLALVARPAIGPAPVGTLLGAAGLRDWLQVPQRLGVQTPAASPLSAAGTEVASFLLTGVGDGQVRADVQATCAAACWWVGVMAVLRHQGVHHLTLQPVTDPVSGDALTEAAAAVALGAATRVLEQHLRTTGTGDPGARLSYCRALAEGVVLEPRIPGLLDMLGELRLVDLVSTTVVWRGQFTKYSGGTGAGQVE